MKVKVAVGQDVYCVQMKDRLKELLEEVELKISKKGMKYRMWYIDYEGDKINIEGQEDYEFFQDEIGDKVGKIWMEESFNGLGYD